MIQPTASDINRQVVYCPYAGARPEVGYITSFNDHFVFVRYGDDKHSKGTRREDLEWQGPAGSRGQVGWMGGEFDRP